MCAIVKEGFYKFTGMTNLTSLLRRALREANISLTELKKSPIFKVNIHHWKASSFRRDTKRTYIQKEAISNKQKCFQKLNQNKFIWNWEQQKFYNQIVTSVQKRIFSSKLVLIYEA